MITLHWSYIAFAIVVGYMVIRLFSEEGDMNFMPLIWFFLIVIATAIFGGIMWW